MSSTPNASESPSRHPHVESSKVTQKSKRPSRWLRMGRTATTRNADLNDVDHMHDLGALTNGTGSVQTRQLANSLRRYSGRDVGIGIGQQQEEAATASYVSVTASAIASSSPLSSARIKKGKGKGQGYTTTSKSDSGSKGKELKNGNKNRRRHQKHSHPPRKNFSLRENRKGQQQQPSNSGSQSPPPLHREHKKIHTISIASPQSYNHNDNHNYISSQSCNHRDEESHVNANTDAHVKNEHAKEDEDGTTVSSALQQARALEAAHKRSDLYNKLSTYEKNLQMARSHSERQELLQQQLLAQSRRETALQLAHDRAASYTLLSKIASNSESSRDSGKEKGRVKRHAAPIIQDNTPAAAISSRYALHSQTAAETATRRGTYERDDEFDITQMFAAPSSPLTLSSEASTPTSKHTATIASERAAAINVPSSSDILRTVRKSPKRPILPLYQPPTPEVTAASMVERRRRKSVSVLERWWCMKRDQMKVKDLRTRRREHREGEAAVAVQRCFRGHVGRRIANAVILNAMYGKNRIKKRQMQGEDRHAHEVLPASPTQSHSSPHHKNNYTASSATASTPKQRVVSPSRREQNASFKSPVSSSIDLDVDLSQFLRRNIVMNGEGLTSSPHRAPHKKQVGMVAQLTALLTSLSTKYKFEKQRALASEQLAEVRLQEMNKARNELDVSKDEYKIAMRQMTSSQRESMQRETELRERLASARELAEVSQQAREVADETVIQFTSDLNALKHSGENQTVELEELREMKKSLQRQCMEQSQRIKDLQADNTRQKLELQGALDRLLIANETIGTVSGDRDTSKMKAERLMEKVSSLQEELHEAHTHWKKRCDRDRTAYEGELDSVKAELHTVISELTSTQRAAHDLQSQNTYLVGQLRVLAKPFETALMEKHELTRQLRTEQKRYTQLRRECTHLRRSAAPLVKQVRGELTFMKSAMTSLALEMFDEMEQSSKLLAQAVVLRSSEKEIEKKERERKGDMDRQSRRYYRHKLFPVADLMTALPRIVQDHIYSSCGVSYSYSHLHQQEQEHRGRHQDYLLSIYCPHDDQSVNISGYPEIFQKALEICLLAAKQSVADEKSGNPEQKGRDNSQAMDGSVDKIRVATGLLEFHSHLNANTSPGFVYFDMLAQSASSSLAIGTSGGVGLDVGARIPLLSFVEISDSSQVSLLLKTAWNRADRRHNNKKNKAQNVSGLGRCLVVKATHRRLETTAEIRVFDVPPNPYMTGPIMARVD